MVKLINVSHRLPVMITQPPEPVLRPQASRYAPHSGNGNNGGHGNHTSGSSGGHLSNPNGTTHVTGPSVSSPVSAVSSASGELPVRDYAKSEFKSSNGSMMSTRSGMNSLKHLRNVSVGWIGEHVRLSFERFLCSFFFLI